MPKISSLIFRQQIKTPSPLTVFLEFKHVKQYLQISQLAALMRDDKQFVRMQGSSINKPIIHIFSSAGKELATIKVTY